LLVSLQLEEIPLANVELKGEEGDSIVSAFLLGLKPSSC